MATARRRSPVAGRLLRSLGRLALLLGLGFGVGLLVGVVAEEPALLYGHLRGKSESVPLAVIRHETSRDIEADSEGSANFTAEVGERLTATRVSASKSPITQPPRVSAGRPKDSPPDDREEPASSKPTPRLESVSPGSRTLETPQTKATNGNRWAIQVGAFSDEAAARRLVTRLESKDYPVVVVPSDGSSHRWRVRVQPLRGEESARDIAAQLKREERLPTWLISLETGTR